MSEYLRGLLEGAGISLRGVDQQYRSFEEVMNDLVDKWKDVPVYAKEDIANEMLGKKVSNGIR